MPLTPFQLRVARLLAKNRSEDSHLAGGAALHLKPNTKRASNDLDYFHDSEERVAGAFAADRAVLAGAGLMVHVEVAQPGYVRALVSSGRESTKVEWAHDSAWRFMPAVRVPEAGWALHPVDLAVNKALALAGRDEARDFLDILYVHDEVLSLGALVWAAVGKDPGFTPLSLLELAKRRGRYRAADFERLRLAEPVDPVALKERWLAALGQADAFVRARPSGEAGCLYYSPRRRRFVTPEPGDTEALPHFGRPGGVLPRLYGGDALVGAPRP
ncbi:MAG: hypothetical protein KGL53_07745 [Elusimicrobia bacterium]|nr:hypothetical protein [Elusimicrobiota bacterium]